MILAVICLDRKLNGLKISRNRASMHGPPSARAAKCACPLKVRGPTQNARAHAKCAGCAMSARDAKCADARKMRGPRFNFLWAALSARAAVAWRGEWAALPTYLPRTCHAMATQCNRGSTRVGRDEPQSPGTLKINFS